MRKDRAIFERHHILSSLVTLLIVTATLCAGLVSLAFAQETLVAPEKNPPGDIPDDQIFVTFTSPAGFSLKVPEGWSRAQTEVGIRFFDKYDVIEVALGNADTAPTAATAKIKEVPDLVKSGQAIEVTAIKDAKLAAGPAVRISYLSNSEPNVVTGKQVLLEHERLIIFKAGKTVTLDLAAPAGADNVDQWQLISNSLRWK